MSDEVAAVSSPSETASAAPDTRSIVSSVMSDLSAESRPASDPSAPSTPSPVAAPTAPQASPQTPAPQPPVPAGTEKPRPPIPVDRHESILRGERTKREAAETRVRDYEQAVIQPMQADPVGWLVTSFAEVLQDPRYAADPRLKSFAGRSLSGRASAPPVTGTGKPEITPLVDGNGNKVFAAEDVQALLDWQQEQILSTVDEKLAPVEALKVEREQQAELAEATATVRKIASKAKRLGDEYRKSPGWTKEIEPHVMARYDQWRKAGHDVQSSIAFAYRDVVIPTLTAKERQGALASLQSKTQPSGSLTSRSVTAPAKAGPPDTRSIARQVMAEAGAL